MNTELKATTDQRDTFRAPGPPEHRRCRRLFAAVRLLRPVQWAKNILVFAPLILAHEVFSVSAWVASGKAFIAFSLFASAVYVLNDYHDVEFDRHHPTKSRRPLASRALPMAWAPFMFIGLLLAGFAVSLALPWLFTLAMCGYVALNFLYSFWLKGKALIDVLLLAGLYTLRIVGGGAATGIVVSDWLLALSVFLFSSLAFVKRYAELVRLADEGEVETRGRGYVVDDLSLLESLGPTSGYMSVLVMALYIRSEAAEQLYSQRWALWLVCPLLLYWVGRIWLKARRRQLSEDPVIFALTDKTSLLLGLITMLLILIASSPAI